MSLVRIALKRPVSLALLAGVTVTFTPVRRYVAPDKSVVEPIPFTFAQDGQALIVDIPPTTLTWVYQVTEDWGTGQAVRYVSVPDTAANVVNEYADLPLVDVGSLAPLAVPPAIWTSALVSEVAAQVAAVSAAAVAAAGAQATTIANAAAATANAAAAQAAAAAGLVTAPTALAIAAARNVVDIRSYLQGAETLDTTGTNNIYAVLTRARTALGALYASTGVPQQLYFPNGRYLMGTTTAWSSGVGIVGESRNGVVFVASSTATAMWYGVVTGTWFTDMVFENFTIDGTGQSTSPLDGSRRLMRFEQVRRSRFTNLTFRNGSNVGLHLASIDNVVVSNCSAEGNGRALTANGADPYLTSPTFTAGFLFATGSSLLTRDELTVINCQALNNTGAGLIIDRVPGGSRNARGIVVSGLVAEGNWVGMRDSNGYGVLTTGSLFTGNLSVGFSADRSHPGQVTGAAGGGLEGTLTGCVMDSNGAGAEARGAFGGGIVLGNGSTGFTGYTVRGNDIGNNVGAGIWLPIDSTPPDRTLIESNRIHDNTGPGIAIDSRTTNLSVVGNTTHANTGTGLVMRGATRTSASPLLRANNALDGVLWEQGFTGTPTRDLNIGETDGPQTLYAYDYTATSVSLWWPVPLSPATGITDYRVEYRIGAAAWSVAPQTLNTNNYRIVSGLTTGTQYQFRVAALIGGTQTSYSTTELATPQAIAPVLLDTFTGADVTSIAGRLAPNGSRTTTAWAVELAAGADTTMGISGGTLKATGGTVGNAFAVLDTGAADGRFRWTVGALNSTALSRRITAVFRYTDARNYWRFTLSSTGTQISVGKVMNNVSVGLFSSSLVLAVGDQMCVHYVGSRIVVSRNGLLVAAFIDPFNRTATKVGASSAATDLVTSYDNVEWSPLS